MSGVASVKRAFLNLQWDPDPFNQLGDSTFVQGREDQLRLLEKRSPELYKRLMVQGAQPMIKLLETGKVGS